jgi:hypothetical protein
MPGIFKSLNGGYFFLHIRKLNNLGEGGPGFLACNIASLARYCIDASLMNATKSPYGTTSLFSILNGLTFLKPEGIMWRVALAEP